MNRDQHLELQKLHGEELTDDLLLHCLSDLLSDVALRPVYDVSSLRWLISLLEKKTALGQLRKVLVRDSQGGIAGWYLYFLSPGAVCKVLQTYARPNCLGSVILHLCHDALLGGALAVTGKLDGRFVKEVTDDLCLYQHWSWVLVHSRDPEIRAAAELGDVFLSRLEGEFWTSFQGEPEILAAAV